MKKQYGYYYNTCTHQASESWFARMAAAAMAAALCALNVMIIRIMV